MVRVHCVRGWLGSEHILSQRNSSTLKPSVSRFLTGRAFNLGLPLVFSRKDEGRQIRKVRVD